MQTELCNLRMLHSHESDPEIRNLAAELIGKIVARIVLLREGRA